MITAYGYMPYGYYYFDWTYILIIIGAVLSLAASAKVNSTYSRYAKIAARAGLSGAETAQKILRSQGIFDVQVNHIAGNLTDHYDPRSKILNLSDSVYGSRSIAAVSVAAHECGHAIQHNMGYVPLTLRSAMVPVVNFASRISWPMIILGLILSGNISTILLYAGVIFFCGAVLFQLVTLPVEFNASSRALRILESTGILTLEEDRYAKKVLSAAALTYVASAAAAILQLLRLLIIIGGRRRND